MIGLAHFALIAAALQQTAVPNDSTARARPDSALHQLKPVVVRDTRSHRYTTRSISSAMKSETPVRNTPQSVSILGRALIADQSMQSMSDAMRYVPGVTVGQGEGHRDAPTIRGQSTTADFFVDGVRDDAQYFRDFYNVERVEVLSGSNAMVFGRGGGGGVVNRVLKRATWEPSRDVTLEAGSFDHVRGMLDIGAGVTSRIAVRTNAMSEHSGAFRDAVELSRFGINPTMALLLGWRTAANVGAEYFEDHRVIDRGIPSFRGMPSGAPITTFFGNPDSSRSSLRLRGINADVQRQFADAVNWRTQARFTRYDKFYQNVFPGIVDSSGATVALSAYNNSHDRTNGFVQSELVARSTKVLTHTMLLGVEAGTQQTDNYRRTGYFNGTAATAAVPFASPTVSIPVSFRQSATDADNFVRATATSLYAQDLVELGRRWEGTLGVRAEHFDVRVDNHRNGEKLSRRDVMVSPRLGMVFKATPSLSAYGSFGVTHLPSSGDQFSSLSATTRTLEPERFRNREAGIKWDLSPMLAVTAAAYRLDRANTSAPDPADATRLVQTGRQRSDGVELTAAGRVTKGWDVSGTQSWQTATILTRTTAAAAGAHVPLVPRSRFALWNRVNVARQTAVGFGAIHQGRSFAAIDNSVRLPAFWRLDGALFLGDIRGTSIQANIENILDTRYYPTSHGNNNIMPGAPRSLRVSISQSLPSR